jgi:hypothetical protein
MMNCILLSNYPPEIVSQGSSNPEIVYNDVEGGWPGTGNIDSDPHFVDAVNGDYHLQSVAGSYHNGSWVPDPLHSPCIDAGNPASPYGSEPEPNGDRVNIGMYGNTPEASKSLIGTLVSGEVYGEWTADGNPYYVMDDLTVPANETLLIGPGVHIQFNGHYMLQVLENATLQALGTVNDTITFVPFNTSEGWSGIRFTNASDDCFLQYCHLTWGKATGSASYGGGIYAFNSNFTLNHSLIDFCTAYGVGGAIYCYSSDAVIRANRIAYNYSDAGGGIYCRYGAYEITDNEIIDNHASINGGGIYLWDAWAVISNNLIDLNSAIYRGGGICCACECLIIGNIISRNYTLFEEGGGVCASSSDPVLINNTIVKNTPSYGVACYGEWSQPALINCILWGNTPAQIYEEGVYANADVTYSDIQRGWEGTGNIDADPMFVDYINDDYRLQWGSPCIDTGDPDPHYNDPDSTRADMGALYYDQGPPSSVSGSQDNEIPRSYYLENNFPNPFNPVTTIPFDLPRDSKVNLKIYDISGRLVTTLISGWRNAGYHKVTWDASNLVSGVYIYHLEAGDFTASQKMVLMK